MIEVPSLLVDGIRHGVILAAAVGALALSVIFAQRRWVPEASLAMLSGLMTAGSKAVFFFVHYTEISWRFVSGGPYQFDALVNILAFFFTQLAQPLSSIMLVALVCLLFRRLRRISVSTATSS